jgi:7-cyano-7-deazaguanine synthase
MERASAIVLLSGGLDSTVAMGVALEAGLECYPLCFNYSQRNKKELMAASSVVREYAARGAEIRTLKTVSIDGLSFDESILTSVGSSATQVYVPCRNIIFMSLAAAFAESVGAKYVCMGFIKVDEGEEVLTPDADQSVIDNMQRVLNENTQAGMQGRPSIFWAPLVDHTKTETVELARSLNVPIELTWSCFSNGKKPCGVCSACKSRIKALLTP